MENDKYSKYLEHEGKTALSDLTFDRRDFLKTTGAGILIFFTIGQIDANAQRRRGRDYPSDFNAYLRIGTDGKITCFSGKIEMGQGIITSLAQMLAEELDVALESVEMIMGDTAVCPYDGGTVGSRSTKYFGPPLRKAAAQARAVLVQLASEQLDAPIDGLTVINGTIHDKSRNKSITYAQLAQGKRIERSLPDVEIKHFSQHTISGHSYSRTDAVEKVTGAARFAGDIQLPEMRHASVLHPPAHGARLLKADTSAARQLDGVAVVEDGDLIACLHVNPEVASNACAKIKAEWKIPDINLSNQNIFTHLQDTPSVTETVTATGDPESGRKMSTKIVDSVYYNHYVAHAPMEPHTAVAQVSGDKIKLWVSTQTPFRVRSDVAESFNVPEENVHIITPFVGGGFGGKKGGRFITDAVRLARITGHPVQVALNRKEEFFYDTFRPAAVIRMTTGIDASGKLKLWHYDNFYAGSRSSEPVYDIPNILVESRETKNDDDMLHPFGTGAWRGPGSNTNVFAMESQTDIMANEAGLDPLSFRLQNLTDKRMIRTLKAAADKFGRTIEKSPSGRGIGIACTNYLNAYVATIAQISVNKKTGHVQVERIVCAQDMGEIINPLGARLQIEGGLTMGIGYALSEEIMFEGGQVLTDSFSDYEFTRFSWSPQIEAVLIENPELAPQGCGEPAITTTGAVLANAVFDALGVRLYTLPMTPERILSALNPGTGR